MSADPTIMLREAMQRVLAQSLGPEFAAVDPIIRNSDRPDFGDFQSNVAMSLSKQLGKKPRDIASDLAKAAKAELGELVDGIDVAGPGFINFRLAPTALANLTEAMDAKALGVVADTDAHAVAIDLCGVNVAKQMHVGHLRSTIIGDSLARLYERLGRTVFRENHLGDWGLPIAMVLHQLRAANTDFESLTLTDLDRAYREAQQKAAVDEAALEAAKRELVKLQTGDPDLVRDWHRLIECTMREVYRILDQLNVRIGPEHNRGESFFRDRLAGVVEAFEKSGLAARDAGALVVRFADRERPLLIQKSDGGYLYATTDLAAVRFRVQELGADRVIYVVDARQRDHFKDVFDAARLIGWDTTKDGTHAELLHVGFGAVLGKDRKPLKTRSGENVTLQSLVEEAIERGAAEVRTRADDPAAPTHGLPDEEIRAIGRSVGIAAIKFADLSSDLVRDYVFDMDRMIAFEGATGPYIQYAHARICSIFTKASIAPGSVGAAPLKILEPAERALVLALLRYGPTIHTTARSLEPHRLCTYLYELANAYSAFYQACPVLKADNELLRNSRLRLCDLTRRVLADGLEQLGIETPTRM
jgi:arginyl-tRNA synthetase